MNFYPLACCLHQQENGATHFWSNGGSMCTRAHRNRWNLLEQLTMLRQNQTMKLMTAKKKKNDVMDIVMLLPVVCFIKVDGCVRTFQHPQIIKFSHLSPVKIHSPTNYCYHTFHLPCVFYSM